MNDAALRAIVLLGGALAGMPMAWMLPLVLRRLGLERTNFQGRPICTSAGILFLVVSLFWLRLGPQGDRVPAAAAAGFGLLGLIDDLWGTPEFKGLRGHFRALRSGRVTTGLLKAVGGALLAIVLATRVTTGWSVAPAALLIALSANLFNLLDLRPLRTLKAFWLFTIGLVWTGPLLLATLLGASLPYAALEGRRRVMLGDVGANALGAAVGIGAAQVLHPSATLVAVLALLAFHAWAEKHSLSEWIRAHRWAHALDQLGWRDEPS